MKSLFEGKSTYKVRCNTCGTISARSARWEELEIALSGSGAGGTSLHDGIGAYLRRERLEGDNKYACERCGEKREAERWVEIGEEGVGAGLPPVGTGG